MERPWGPYLIIMVLKIGQDRSDRWLVTVPVRSSQLDRKAESDHLNQLSDWQTRLFPPDPVVHFPSSFHVWLVPPLLPGASFGTFTVAWSVIRLVEPLTLGTPPQKRCKSRRLVGSTYHRLPSCKAPSPPHPRRRIGEAPPPSLPSSTTGSLEPPIHFSFLKFNFAPSLPPSSPFPPLPSHDQKSGTSQRAFHFSFFKFNFDVLYLIFFIFFIDYNCSDSLIFNFLFLFYLLHIEILICWNYWKYWVDWQL